MSLLDEYMESFIVLDRRTELDGYGSTYDTYTDGVTIQAAMPYVASTATNIAQAEGTKNIYTITVKKGINLDFHTVLRRKSNGMTLRITNKVDDNKTPDSASLDMRQYTAEQYTLPSA